MIKFLFSSNLLLLLLSTILILQHETNALYTKNDAVISLTPQQWPKVKNSKHVVLAEFYAPWCGHCKNLAPQYKKAAEKLKGLAKVVAIDCDQHQQLCSQHGIQGFPTIKLFQSDKSKPILDYNGQREAAPMVEYVVSKIPGDYVVKVSKSNDFFDNKDLAKAVLFNKKPSTPPLFKALGIEYDKRLLLGEVKENEKDLVEQYGIKTFPSVVLFTKDNERIDYDGVLKHAGLTEFFDKYALSKGNDDDSKPDSKKKQPKKEFDPTIQKLVQPDDIQKHCISLQKTCIVTLISPNEEETEQEILNVLVENKRKHGDHFTFSFIDTTDNEMYTRLFSRAFDVSDMYPSVVAVNLNRGWYRNFRGAYDASGVDSFLTDLLKGRGKSSKISDLKMFDGLKVDRTEHHDEL